MHLPRIYRFALGFTLALVLALFSGCPNTNTACLNFVPILTYSTDICSPKLVTLDNLNEPTALDSTLLVDKFCPTIANADNVQILRLQPPSSGELILHHYKDFPGVTYLEVMGYKCQDNSTELLSEECLTTDAVASSHSISVSNAADYDVLLLFVVAKPRDGVDLNEATIKLAAFKEVPAPALKPVPGQDDDNRERPVLACGGDRFNRIIISATDPDFDLSVFATYHGLKAQQCHCNENLLALEIPYGLSLETTGPIIREKSPDVDTTGSGLSFGFDWVITTPLLGFNPNGGPLNGTANDGNDLGVKGPPSSTFGPDCIDYAVPTISTNAPGPLVTIIDSGVDLVSDNDLNKFGDQSALLCNNLPMGEYGYDFLLGNDNPVDEIGHGTGVAGAVLSTYPKDLPLRMQHYKFIGAEGGSFFAALCGIYTAISTKTDVLNLSWGISLDTLPPALERALAATEAENVLVVTSAGNDSLDLLLEPNWPASASGKFTNLLAVGAYEYDVADAPIRIAFSNFNEKVVAIAAPYGLEVPGLNGTYHEQIGTSIAAPQVTAWLAAMRQENEGINLSDAIKLLRDRNLIRNSRALDPTEIFQGEYLFLDCN